MSPLPNEGSFWLNTELVELGILTRMEMLFLYDLMDQCLHGRAEQKIVEEAGEPRVYSQCTIQQMQQSLLWDPSTQRRILRSLQNKGLIQVKLMGKPRKRWVWVHLVELQTALTNARRS